MKQRLLPQSIILCLLICMVYNGSAQMNTVHLLNDYKPLPVNLKTYVQNGQTASFNKIIAAQLLQSKPEALNFTFTFENREWVVELNRSEILSKGFFVTTGSNPNDKFNYANLILHYKGKIKNNPNSFAAISILPDKLVAVIADERSNINIGAINTPEARLTSEHIIYRDADLRIANEFACNTPDNNTRPESPLPVYPNSVNAATINTEPVDMYFEADFATYNNNGANITNTVNYVTALFNVVHTLYENDSVNTRISAIKVWNVADPYLAIGTSSPVLSAFSSNMANGFPGDLAHFLSQRGLGGGVAFVNVLCSGNSSKTAVSGNLSNSFGVFPTYSWSAMVITHESGHNIGSPHTQSCSWAGGAIDNCYTTEGGCAAGPAPVNGGTIMSYCHLTGYGINFANGFGPLPGALIRNRVRNNTCIYPGVYFETTFQNITEENADVENGCFDYKLLTTKLKIPYAPSQPADITLQPTGNSGLITGTHNDIEISPMSFVLDTNNLSQTIQFKVYNDAQVENTETLSLNFNINANGGNAVKRNSSFTHTINITSQDHRPDSSINELLYYEPFDSITGMGNWMQTVLYGNASPNRWVIGNSGDAEFPTKALYISNNGSTLAYSGAATSDSATVRIESPVINATGFSNLLLSYLYKCNGEYIFVNGGGTIGGGLTPLDYGKVYYSINNGSTWTMVRDNIYLRTIKQTESIPLPADASNSPNLKIAFEWRNNTTVVNNPPLILDSLVIKGTSVTTIQSAAHAANSVEEYLGPNQTVHYYNPVTKNVMATIENTSAFDFGCTRVELVRTGNGADTAWGNLPGEKISDKVFKITPANANAAASYNITLYYTNAEVNGLLTATGNSLADIRIVKTEGDITQTPPSSPAQFSGVNNRSNYGNANHSAFTASFTGFSSFAIMKPFAVPVCAGSNPNYTTGISGTAYQWEVNTGSGFNTIINDAVYSGATADTLKLLNPPTSWYGNSYRCAVTTPLGIAYTPAFTLKFSATWMGTVNNAWENGLNWGCGLLPDAFTDVVISGSAPNTPRVNANTSVRSVKLQPGSNVQVTSGVNLVIIK